ncbi:MAG: hypothetical protein KGR26_01620 [Cyanobacteria bacterium REEB65]|nr:hypothetical protein [Cyanobacteria bacterium REEB65]
MRWFRMIFAVGAISTVAGCQAFAMGNPLLPRARLQANVEDPTTTITITPTSAKDFTYTVSPTVTRFLLSPIPGDIAPASTITAYQIQWFDINGATISPSLIPERTQGVSISLPKGLASNGTTGAGTTTGTTGTGVAPTTGTTGTGTGNSGEVDVPVVSTALTSYGFDNGYTLDPIQNLPVPRSDPWSQYLTGKVIFSGRDDNGWPIVGSNGVDPVVAYFQLQFVTLASGSTTPSGSSTSGG